MRYRTPSPTAPPCSESLYECGNGVASAMGGGAAPPAVSKVVTVVTVLIGRSSVNDPSGANATLSSRVKYLSFVRVQESKHA